MIHKVILSFAASRFLVVQGHSYHEHAPLMGTNPAALGFQPLPLDLSYDHVELSVQGEVPAYVNGTLYRGAPGFWPDGWWLDGLITLNAFKFEKGKVLYSMQWNKDEAYNRTLAKTPPAPPLPASVVPGTIPHPANSSWPTGVAFRQVQGVLIGSTGVSNVNSFDPDSLCPLETPFEYADELGGPYLSPTHEQTLDGVVVHHLVKGVQKNSGGDPGYIVTSIQPGTRKRDVLATIDKPKESSPFKGLPSFQHMPLVTSEYYIMLESPCYYPDTVTVVGEVDWKGWESDTLLARTHVRLVSRSTGKSLLYPLTHNLFAIHHINAYHDVASNSIIVDTIQLFPSFLPCSLAFRGTTLSSMSSSSMEGVGLSGSKPTRLVLPLDKPGSDVEPKLITTATGMEFPTIRYDDYNGKPYQYAYGNWITSSKATYYDGLIKLNVQTGNYTTWHVDGHYPGEPIFVADPHGSSEDSGVVMTNVLDGNKNQTYLLLLDGATMKPLAHVGPTPHAIPHGYHGRYYNRKLNAPVDTQILV